MCGLARGDHDAAARTPQRLIETANTDDRYLLFNDSSVPFPNLDDSIHPVFRRSNFRNVDLALYENMRPSLQFASMFLESNAMLEWFIRPAFGVPMRALRSGKIFLSEPSQSKQRKAEMIREIRSFLIGLSYSVQFQFVYDLKCFALTIKDTSKDTSYLARLWSPIFKSAHPTVIKLRARNRVFFERKYSSSSLSDKLRFNYMFATTIIHELMHAFGIMVRGNLREPYYHLADPQAELGWSWENFALSGIINPFDRTSARVSFLMWKMWLTDEDAYANGGKEWTAVPVRWISQWFQKSTWEKIATYGPQAIAPPSCGLKLHCSGDGCYTVFTDSKEAVRDVLRLKSEALDAAHRLTDRTRPSSLTSVTIIKTNANTVQNLAQEKISKASVSYSNRTSQALAHAGLTLDTTSPILHVAAVKRLRGESIGDSDSDYGSISSHSRRKSARH